jgi:hypothetical protein
MNQKGVRWCYVMTDWVFVAIERGRRFYGDVNVSEPVTWDEGGCGGMSVVLAIWYVCMMAAEDRGWDMPTLLVESEVNEEMVEYNEEDDEDDDDYYH